MLSSTTYLITAQVTKTIRIEVLVNATKESPNPVWVDLPFARETYVYLLQKWEIIQNLVRPSMLAIYLYLLLYSLLNKVYDQERA